MATEIPSTSHVTPALRPGGVFRFRVRATALLGDGVTFSAEVVHSQFSGPSDLVPVPLEGELRHTDASGETLRILWVKSAIWSRKQRCAESLPR